MRYIYFCIISVISLFVVSSSAAEPYTARITADGVAVRSGPGIEFYPVLQLQTGDEVEVYHEQDGWCAIRPPIGSFSWVSASYVAIGSDNLGTVLADGLASRIGSSDSDDCETVQITLNKGESVLVLGRRGTPENSASPAWLKIAPPSGEFRWIHKSSMFTPSIRQVRYDAMVSEIPELPKVMEPGRTFPVPAMPTPRVASASPTLNMSRNTSRTSAVDPFQKAFNELQREAYVVMTRPTEDDVFAVLIHRAEELHQIAPTDHDLEKTYHLLETLQRTRIVRQELALRRPATLGTAQQFSPLTPKLAGNSGTPSPHRQSIVPAYTPTSAQSVSTPLRAGVNVGGYDIVGRLGEFDPLPQGHPPYAVVDEKEQVICMISPSENLDLSPYIGQFVGINGVLGFYERQQGKPRARHITARNIKNLR
ncbi:MAG: SH3 domain-containing protein [Planctomycetaceae bacterium]|nr:SH3 domain-containing protein [Planctomycetaceae bacterium]